jgi:hypothetical protein
MEIDMTQRTTPIDPDQEIGFMNVDDTDFAALSLGQRLRSFEVEGFAVLPDVLDPDLIARLKAELAHVEMRHKDYSVHQTVAVTPPQWLSRSVAQLIGHPPVIEFLTALMGPDMVFTRGHFQRTHGGSPGISLHTDGQPFGSSLFGYEGSAPRLVRVLYYLDDLLPERAPFRLVPRSHLSFHADANPYTRYESHPEEITLCPRAGSAVVIPKDLFHGTHPNRDEAPREMIQFGYRPAWAGPVQPMQEWDPALVAAAPEQAQPFLQSLNTTGQQWQQEHKPKDMKSAAPGIDPGRWDR